MEELKEKIGEREKICVQRTQERLGLAEPPILFVKVREAWLQEDQTTYCFDQEDDAIEPPEQYGDSFCNPWGTLRTHYPLLYYEVDKNAPLEAFVIEARLEIGQVTISGGYDWLAFGTLLSEDKFCAVLGLRVREMLRDTGIASLLKLHEITMGYDHPGCRFIETCHWMGSSYFIPAILPSLRNGFLICPGEPACEDDFVHLRKYFDEKRRHTDLTLRLGRKRPQVIRTPEQNELLSKFLISAKDAKRMGEVAFLKVTEPKEY
jgi:hypothetical protein